MFTASFRILIKRIKYSTSALLKVDISNLEKSVLPSIPTLIKNDFSLWRTAYPNGELGLNSICGLPICLQLSPDLFSLLDAHLELSDFDELSVIIPIFSLEQIWQRALFKPHYISLFKICLYFSNQHITLSPDLKYIADAKRSKISPAVEPQMNPINAILQPAYSLSHTPNTSDFFNLHAIEERFLTEIYLLRSRPYASTFGLPIRDSLISPLEHLLFEKVRASLDNLEALMVAPQFSLASIKNVLNPKIQSNNVKDATPKKALPLSKFELPIKKGNYSPEELTAFKKLTELNFSASEMSFFLPIRDIMGLFYLIKRLHQISKYSTGPWSPLESNVLRKAVAEFSRNLPQGTRRPYGFWDEVSKQVSSRSRKQCIEHFNRVLSPNLKKYAPFTLEEDSVILGLPKTITSSILAESLPGRTIAQVRARRQVICNPYPIRSDADINRCPAFKNEPLSSGITQKQIPNRYSEGLNKKRLGSGFSSDERIIFSRLFFYLGSISGLCLFFPGRTFKQLSWFSSTFFHPSFELSHKFSDYSLDKLFDLFLDYGFDWESIAKEFPEHISPKDCASRIKHFVRLDITHSVNSIIHNAVVINFTRNLPWAMK
ncbi:Myb- protein A [Entomophthora muscae]|uniref:Myb- protein A n=1 Tax=Entomophthora muscae TaxID=34485 RepID=A0ACC2TBQ5_9FUNG|nr:Myb- protein A [Entomophthora muscae]